MPNSTDCSRVRCAGPISRRSFLEVGSLACASLGLADLLRLRAEASAVANSSSDTSVIFIYLPGGLPHMETYDMKPDAPMEYRGEFRPIRTNVPGIEVCEHLPLHAQIADRFAILRSMSHEYAEHPKGAERLFTCRNPKKPVGDVNGAPAGFSIVAKEREHLNRGIPNYISAVDTGRGGVDVFNFGSAYLGPAYAPFTIEGDPSEPGFKVNNLSLSNEVATRLDDRQALLKGLDHLHRNLDRSGAMAAMDKFNQQAIDLLTNPQARNAFDLSQESPATRSRYGDSAWGQRTLLARRLIEAGTSMVNVVLEHPRPRSNYSNDVTYNWDCHAVSCHVFNDMRYRLPYFDQTISALIEDLYSRGLDKKVMVIVAGEFGHTPRISYGVNTRSGILNPGRDHWPVGFSILVSGGGLRMGQVIGSTNAKGEVPKDRPLTPNDLWATIYRHLGIDASKAYLDHSGRPMPILPFGEPIRELI
jgi:hypothetical protein